MDTNTRICQFRMLSCLKLGSFAFKTWKCLSISFSISTFFLVGFIEESSKSNPTSRIFSTPNSMATKKHLSNGPPHTSVHPTFRILAFLYKFTTRVCHFDKYILIKWPTSRDYYPILAGMRNVRCIKKQAFITLKRFDPG